MVGSTTRKVRSTLTPKAKNTKKLPKKLDFGPFSLPVVIDKKAFEKNKPKKKSGHIYYGYIDWMKGVFINPKMVKDLEIETLVHEIVHGWMEVCGLSEALNSLEHDVINEEFLVSALSPQVVVFLRNNPDFVKLFKE